MCWSEWEDQRRFGMGIVDDLVNKKLDNLTIVFDVNQSQTRCLQLKNIDEISEKFGCDVDVVDGHDDSQIKKSLGKDIKDKPKVIVEIQ